ncbi:MAG: tetratricopeptide repeat protein, partial [Breznakiellaceae bacterium]
MSPVDIQSLWERARGAFRLGDYREAERLLLLYLQQNPPSREARLLLGITLAKEEKHAEAEKIFKELLAENPRDLEALNNLAVIYRRQERF